jgi:hypothetical protein
MSENSMEYINAVDLIGELENEVKKARVMLSSLTLDFFNLYDPEDRKDQWQILHDYPRYETYAEILSDIIHAMYMKIDEYKRESKVIEIGKVS